MKFIRAELHNHSTESDGALSVESLAAYAAEKNFGVLALTDHNTTSGHAKAYDAIRRAGYALALLPGVEITTFFGHILALGLVQMPDITTLDPRAPEPFFAMLRTAGAVFAMILLVPSILLLVVFRKYLSADALSNGLKM